MFDIPPLSTDKVHVLVACLHFELDDYPKLRSFFGRTRSISFKIDRPDEETLFCRKIIDSDGEVAHFHLEVSTPKGAGFYSIDRRESGKGSPEIDKQLHGVSALASFWGREVVSRSKLADNGIILALSGVSTRLGDYAVDLTGGTVDLTGDGPLKEMRWWERGEADFTIEVTGLKRVTIGDDLLVHAASIVELGTALLLKRPKTAKKRSKKNNADKQ
jgi:hypothetical protein